MLDLQQSYTQRDETKRRFLDEWVRAVNSHGGFGRWVADVSREPQEVTDVLERHAVR